MSRVNVELRSTAKMCVERPYDVKVRWRIRTKKRLWAREFKNGRVNSSLDLGGFGSSYT